MTVAAAVILALTGVNLLTFGVFAFDKWLARNRWRRIPEPWLLALALVGGSPAAKLGQHSLRHKTRKLRFARRLNAIVAIHGGLAIAAIVAKSYELPGFG